MTVEEFGVLKRGGERPVLRFERRFAEPPGVVWRALTEDEHLEAWFPTTIEGDRAAGAALTFRHRNADLPAMEGEMLVFEPPSVLELTWGGDRLRFELAADGGGTAFALSVEMQEYGKLARDGAGWHVCLGKLAQALDSEAPAPAEWGELNARYADRLGPEAATIGPPAGMENAGRT